TRFWGKKAPENPWGSTTLEWSTPDSPPPFDNFGGKVPIVYRGPYEFVEGGETDYIMQTSPGPAVSPVVKV
ncbi:MAG: hypothetical protein ABI142_08465, partial [Bryocella sp.]